MGSGGGGRALGFCSFRLGLHNLFLSLSRMVGGGAGKAMMQVRPVLSTSHCLPVI